MQGFVRLLCAFGVVFALSGQARAEAGLEGDFFGIEAAEGMSLDLDTSESMVSGRLTDASGNSTTFEAEIINGSAETVIDLNGMPAFLRMTPLPAGVSVSWTPIDTSGTFLAGQTVILPFLREGTVLPDLPEFFVAPPDRPGTLITGNSFLSSYEFWTADGVVRGYEALPQKFRTLMRMFPRVQLDVIRLLCQAPDGGRAQALALRGQGLSCGEVTSQFEAMVGDGRFDRFKEEMHGEKKIFIDVVRCADGYPMSKAECDSASRELAARAVSMETSGTILSRFR